MKQVRLLRTDEIECRVGSINEKGLQLLLYKDARVDQNILDETYTPLGWRRSHQYINGSLYCTVDVWDGEKQQWVAKQDVGTESHAEREKGQASDSFKRACFNWGIGRELYSAPFIWIPSTKVHIEKKENRYVTSDRFQVRSISYNSQREIDSIIIVNAKGKNVFELKKTAGRVGLPEPEIHGEDEVEKAAIGMMTERQIEALEKELERTGVTLGTVLKRYKLQSLEQMTPEICRKALNSLKKTASKEAA